jgi:hypothetical protein
MRIVGEWPTCDDGVARPVVTALIVGSDGQSLDEAFLVDTGSDRTVFRSALRVRLKLTTFAAPPGFKLAGIGGTSDFVPVVAILEFTDDDRRPVRVRGHYSVFTDPAASDMSILGRDVLNNFDVIVSRLRNEVLLLSQSHQYRVVRT